MASFSKFERPAVLSRGHISDRDLDIIEAILRYRLSPTSELVRLVGGNEDVTQRRLRKLWEWNLVNRFAFPGFRTHSEFIYYLDRAQSVELLVQHGRLIDVGPQIEDELRTNRESDYANAVLRGEHMKLGFLQHGLMISRMHFMLEMASRDPGNQFKVIAWRQGAELRGTKIKVPEISSHRISGTNQYVWKEQDTTSRLPVEPDALFTLHFPTRPSHEQAMHFCYEADRGTMTMAAMLKKFRAYYHLIKKAQQHREAFGVHPVRAVLVETTNEVRARKLMELAQHPTVVGSRKRSGLFWFTISPIFLNTTKNCPPPSRPAYLNNPGAIFSRIWALPDRTLHALNECENSPSTTAD